MVCLCVCLLVTFMRRAKTVELVKVPFGELTCVALRNLVLDGVEMTMGSGNFGGGLSH